MLPQNMLHLLFMKLVVVSCHSNSASNFHSYLGDAKRALKHVFSDSADMPAIYQIRDASKIGVDVADAHQRSLNMGYQYKTGSSIESKGTSTMANIDDRCDYENANETDLFEKAFSKVTLDNGVTLKSCSVVGEATCGRFVRSFVFKSNPTVYEATNPLSAMCCRTCFILGQAQAKAYYAGGAEVSQHDYRVSEMLFTTQASCSGGRRSLGRHRVLTPRRTNSDVNLLESGPFPLFKILLSDDQALGTCTEMTLSSCDKQVNSLVLKDDDSVFIRSSHQKSGRDLCCLTCQRLAEGADVTFLPAKTSHKENRVAGSNITKLRYYAKTAPKMD